MRAHPAAGLVCAAVNRQPKVPQHQGSICLEEYVFWLDVSVDDASAVQLLKYAQQGYHHLRKAWQMMLQDRAGRT
jgi:hypothetical protein